MEEYKKSFINFMVDSQVLKFGEFTLKSGRKSPFFMNAGAYKTGSQLIKLGEYYARANGRDIKYCCNRKEIKDHGDKGILLGTRLRDEDRVMIIEDVTTSGASIAETVPIIRAQADVDIVGLMVSLDRREVGPKGTVSALEEIREDYGFPTSAIVTMDEVQEYLYNRPIEGKVLIDKKIKKSLDSYYAEYGVKKSK